MSKKSNNQGRAYEYACCKVLNHSLKNFGTSTVIKNSSFDANKSAWKKISELQQIIYKISAQAAVKTILELEPRLRENSADELTLEFLKDNFGIKGDVRDLVIKRKDSNWEIGLSIKHNHDAVKHSRLSHKIDFGAEWFDKPCHQNYWSTVNPIFDRLKILKAENKAWSDIKDKSNSVYLPILQAFMTEIKLACQIDKNVPFKMFEYLIGVRDYYKVMSHDKKLLTVIQTFNLHGTLNQPSKKIISAITVPKISLPTELVAIRLKNNSKTTVEMYLNNGWQLNFRIHNASTKVEPSLKFDIKFVGMPPEILSIECFWKAE